MSQTFRNFLAIRCCLKISESKLSSLLIHTVLIDWTLYLQLNFTSKTELNPICLLAFSVLSITWVDWNGYSYFHHKITAHVSVTESYFLVILGTAYARLFNCGETVFLRPISRNRVRILSFQSDISDFISSVVTIFHLFTSSPKSLNTGSICSLKINMCKCIDAWIQCTYSLASQKISFMT